jgi:hypothetical protein
MSSFMLDLPADFADYEWEVEAKGWFVARLAASGRQYLLNIYDPVRLGQTIEDDLKSGRVFFEPNLVVVETVTRANIERAATLLIESGWLANLVPEEPKEVDGRDKPGPDE